MGTGAYDFVSAPKGALEGTEGVRAESHGEGPDRRVQIIPVKGTSSGVAERAYVGDTIGGHASARAFAQAA